jgi:signal transduction histidine kinase
VLDRSSELVDCDRAWIVVQEAGALRVLGALDGGGTRVSVDEDAVAGALAAQVIATGEELWSEAGTEDHDRLVRESPAEFGASAAIAVVPLRRASGVSFGALLFGWRTDHVFKPANRDLKRAVARITAQSLERAELYAAQAARISDLAERETVRDAFLAVLSHELRTPVTTIFGVSAILGRTETDAGTAELLRDIQEEAERLRRIVDDLLVLSRSERGAIEISPEPILLQRTVSGIVTDIAHRYPDVEVQFHAKPFVPAAMADPTALVQVIYNLVTNAIKYAGEDGPIAVTVDSGADGAAVSVADHGPGLGDEPDAVFALFHRADHTKRRAAGTGIGLYVARELVRAMGGEIVGTNRHDGGAEFRFTLPFAELELASPPLAATGTTG